MTEKGQGDTGIAIRPETAADRDGVFRVNADAFDTDAEARLVEALRKSADPVISLVAECDGELVGHILFSPVMVAGHPEASILGLAPMAVSPANQRQGIGSALVRAGLETCRGLGAGAVVVLGHPAYYPRFGFVPASRFGIGCEYEVPDEAFMACELTPGFLDSIGGTVSYHPVFNEV